jgi:hypothetical protein
MRRFQAPDHVTALVCFAGEFRADENGVLKVADDAPEGLFPILAANGWAELLLLRRSRRAATRPTNRTQQTPAGAGF